MAKGLKFTGFIGLVVVCFLVFTSAYAFSQTTWARTYGGSGRDEDRLSREDEPNCPARLFSLPGGFSFILGC